MGCCQIVCPTAFHALASARRLRLPLAGNRLRRACLLPRKFAQEPCDQRVHVSRIVSADKPREKRIDGLAPLLVRQCQQHLRVVPPQLKAVAAPVVDLHVHVFVPFNFHIQTSRGRAFRNLSGKIARPSIYQVKILRKMFDGKSVESGLQPLFSRRKKIFAFSEITSRSGGVETRAYIPPPVLGVHPLSPWAYTP